MIILNHFTLQGKLKHSLLGAVYKAINKSSNKAVAIKILPAEDVCEQHLVITVCNVISIIVVFLSCCMCKDLNKLAEEIGFLKRLSSSYVVSYIEGYLFDGELWVIA